MPVLDLGAADFTIKEDGKAREAVNVAPARAPMQIASFVDDNGTGIFRSGLVSFVQLLQGRAEMSLEQRRRPDAPARRLYGECRDADRGDHPPARAARNPRRRPAPRGYLPGGEGPGKTRGETADDRRADRRRRGAHTLPAHHVLDQLAKSGSALDVIPLASSSPRSTRRIDKPSALLEENLNLSEVLGEGPKQTGGWREIIVASPGDHRRASSASPPKLKNQYAVAYSRPPKSRSTERLARLGQSAAAWRCAPPARFSGR